MKLKIITLLGIAGVLLTSCQSSKKEDPIATQRFVHKYGYALTKAEWDANLYPGQVISTLKNGVTIASTYENGQLHGATTHTFPNSQAVESYIIYNQGEKVKEIQYDIQGMPIREIVNLSPTRFSQTLWYAMGTPMRIEEYSQEELVDGQYFSKNNELEARVEKGNGSRICRDRTGLLLSKDEVASGYMSERQTFYATGVPESSTHYLKGLLNGEKKSYTQQGEPLAIEEWVNGKLHGKCTYFKNGTKDYEVSYLAGLKEGQEVHYLDGKTVLKEVSWEGDKMHGPSTYYQDGLAKTLWFYNGEEVSARKYQEQAKIDEMITHISQDVKTVR